MTTTVSFSASMRTRKSNSSSNSKSSQACQEFYTSGYNYVGILHFSGLNLQNKVITAVSLAVYSEKAGYGAGHTKTVYLRKSYHQEASASGVIGRDYCAEPLGTFTGSFYGNTTTTAFTGSLLTNVASYLAAGNNTFCIYNPSPTASSQGYSNNYLMWSTATLSVTYEEGVSSPSTSASSVALGSSVTINTNRLSSSATHTLTYTFGSASGTIATNVGASTGWTPPLSLASQIPSATSGYCTITCLREWEPDRHFLLFRSADCTRLRCSDHFQPDLRRSCIRHRCAIRRICETEEQTTGDHWCVRQLREFHFFLPYQRQRHSLHQLQFHDRHTFHGRK